MRWPEDASDNEPNMRLARELHVRRVLVTASVMLPRVFPEGTSEGGRDPAALGGTRTGCSITAQSHMFP